MSDAESDASCQAPCPQNNPQPSAPSAQLVFAPSPHQLPQPWYGDNGVENVSWYVNELIEMLLEVLDGSESDGDRTFTWKKHDKAGRSTSVHICVHRARSRSPRRQVGEPQAAANPHAESHPGLAPAKGKEGKDYI